MAQHQQFFSGWPHEPQQQISGRQHRDRSTVGDHRASIEQHGMSSLGQIRPQVWPCRTEYHPVFREFREFRP